MPLRPLLALLAVFPLSCGPASSPPESTPTEAPQVRVLAPAPGQSVTVLRVRVEGTATDDTGLSSLTWELNGGAPQALSVEALGAEGAFRFEVTPRPGPNTLVLRATDTQGKTAEAASSFYLGALTGAGSQHSGVVRDGLLYTWGSGTQGQLGLGEELMATQLRPLKVPGFEDVAAISFNHSSSLALKADGTVWAWGDNTLGQLGLGSLPEPGQPRTEDFTPRPSPTRISTLSGAVGLSLGRRHALVLLEDGTVRAFGSNSHGQLGDGTSGGRKDYPVAVAGLTEVVKVAADNSHSVALLRDGTVWTWGNNMNGTLGMGTADTASHPLPVQVPGLSGVVDIATGNDHVLALHEDGTVSSWGEGSSGQLGTGTLPPGGQSNAPVKVQGLMDARAVFAGWLTSYARRADGTLVLWGLSFNSRLGNGSTTAELEPKPAALGLTKPRSLTLSDTHTVSFRADGELFTWGWNVGNCLGREDLLENWTYADPIQVVLP